MCRLFLSLIFALALADFAYSDDMNLVKFVWIKVPTPKGDKKPFSGKIRDENFKLSTKNGLPSNRIVDVLQLKDGAYVFGTNHGLSFWKDGEITTYTGQEYIPAQNRTIKGNSPLPHNSISDLLVDTDNALWISTTRGICRIDDKGKWSVLKSWPAALPADDSLTNPDNFPYSEFDDVQKMFLTSRKDVVFGTRKAGVFIYHHESGKTSTIYCDQDMNHWVTAIDEDAKGNLYVAIFSVGVLKYDGKSYEIITDKEKWIPSNKIRSLCVDKTGNVWVGTHSGLGVRFTDGREKIFTEKEMLPDNTIWDLFLSGNGAIWGNADGKIFVYNNGEWKYPVLKKGKLFCAGYAVFDESNDGALWIGCSDGVVRNPVFTIKKKNSKKTQFIKWCEEIEKRYPNISASRTVLKRPDNSVWAIFDRSSLWRYDGASWRDLTRKYQLKNGIWFLKSDSRNRVYIGTTSGFLRIDNGKVLRFNDKKKNSKAVTYDIAVSQDGTAYIGTQGGLFRLAGDKLELLSDGIWCQYVRVVIDKHDNIWLKEANSGIFVYKNGNVERIPKQSVLEGFRLRDMRLNNDGSVRVEGDKRTKTGVIHKVFHCDLKNVYEIK